MKYALCTLLVAGVILGCAPKMVNLLSEVGPAARSSYGYDAEDPIQIGFYGNPGKCMGLCDAYIARLRTSDNQLLEPVAVATVIDPSHAPKKAKFLGLPLRDAGPRGGLLDLYLLVPENGGDTVRLYFDIYHKDSLRVPQGLHFLQPQAGK